MNRRQKIIVSVTGIFIVLLALVGVTFAYFLTRIQGNTNPTSISVTTADLKLVYGDGSGVVTATNVEPGWTNDGESGRPAPKTFIVTNEGNETVENFNIYMEDVINSLSRKEDLIYTITCVNTTDGATSTECAEFNVIENEVTGDDELIFPSVMSVIATDTLEEGETHTYTLKVTYKNLNDVDQSEDMGKRFNAKINIYDAKTKFLASEIMNNSKSTNTVDYNKTIYVKPELLGVEENTSKIAYQFSGENERLLSFTFDDEGTSFYYRGNIEDNYVTFANMCWKIVRIQGDGSVKLILEDKDEPCSETMNGNWDIGSGNYGYTIYGPGQLGGTNSVNESEIYLLDYLSGTENQENSMAVAFQEFQDSLSNTISTIYGKNINQTLQSGGWCLGDIAYIEETGELLKDYDTKLDNMLAKKVLVYDPVFRNYVADEYTTSFKCVGTKLDKFGDEVTPMYVGAMTIDEVVHAGAIYDNFIFHSYISNDYQEENELEFLTLSHTYFDETMDYITYASHNYFSFNDLYTIKEEDIKYSFRPVINLSKNTKIISGNGTNKNPYVISN